jgi:hypothetical protein
MPGKMRDEELSEAQRALHAGDSSEADWTGTWGDAVFAHIAAIRQRVATGDARGAAYNAFSQATKRGATHVEALRDAITAFGNSIVDDA